MLKREAEISWTTVCTASMRPKMGKAVDHRGMQPEMLADLPMEMAIGIADLFTATSGPSGLPLLAAFAMLLVDTVLYGALAIYLERVWPRQHGRVEHPLFCLLPSRGAAANAQPRRRGERETGVAAG